MGQEHHVHVGFGFHVNCYHSYRGDTCDALGFGGDIRIIRHILDTLDDWNKKGVPVKGTWDFENAYSLEEILPKYAPDIIERVKVRQERNGDENILMGYNNGAMSAMTEEEFFASVNWAITNPYGSGLSDIFGSCERIIRPQEVMFTPSQAALYRKAGIEAVCLYYSCIPFDAFRTLIPQLPDEKAFNPLRYTYEGESITILPTYSNSDLMDAGSLRWLVTDLHGQQRRGMINRDVFVFINIDADSFLWEPLPVPKLLRRLPNFNGISGLIREVADLAFVRFDTPGGYLKGHEMAGEITFGEDVADGNFSGYASWAEKPFNRQIWSRLERARAYAAYRDARKMEGAAFEERVRLLSTTHFGLASPVMNIAREKKALELSARMLEKEGITAGETGQGTEKTATIQLARKEPSELFGAQLSLDAGFCGDIRKLQVEGRRLISCTVMPMDTWEDGSVKTIYLLARLSKVAKTCTLKLTVPEASEEQGEPQALSGTEKRGALSSGGLTLRVSKKTGFPVLADGKGTLARVRSWIDYDGRRVSFGRPVRAKLELGGVGRGLRFSGEIHLPGELEPGSYRFDFVESPAVDGLVCVSDVRYPYTFEDHEISSQASNLGRYSDVKWHQAAPMELTVRLADNAAVEKRNFMRAVSRYPLADFWTSFPENAKISSFNHQLTGGMLCVRDGERGLRVIHARQVLGSMAHCPMRLDVAGGLRQVSLNPFGTYFGAQRHYPTRGNGCVMALYNATMPQARSLAPAYNGARERGVQLFVSAPASEDEVSKRECNAFADGAVRLAESGGVHVFSGDNVTLHEAKKKTEQQEKLKAVTSSGMSPADMARMVGRYLSNMREAIRKLRTAEHRL